MISARRKKHIGALATGTLFAIMFVFGGQRVQAAIIHNYTCADWSVQGSATCTADVVTFTTLNTQSMANNGSGNTMIDLSNSGVGSIVYVTATVSPSAGTLKFFCGGSMSNCSLSSFTSGLNSEKQMIVGSQGGGGFAYLILTNDTGSAAGTVSSICVDDDGTSCTGGGGGGGGSASTSTINCVKAASSTDCLIQEVDNANIDYAIGIALFLFGVWFSIWMFRK